MPTCFVIQPFDKKFVKRYDDVYKPALTDAGLEPYRVDQDPSTEKLIDSIEEQIASATICLADITTDNPNVWYELGYAFAVGRSVIMVCSNERDGKYPFDIQHRTVIQYASESRSDFDKLRDDISTRAKALAVKNAARQVIEAQQVAPTGGLTQAQILTLAIMAGETTVPGQSFLNPWAVRQEATNSGLTETGFAVALRGLQQMDFVEFVNLRSGRTGLRVTDTGWDWSVSNDSLFSLFKEKKANDVELTEDDLPF